MLFSLPIHMVAMIHMKGRSTIAFEELPSGQ